MVDEWRNGLVALKMDGWLNAWKNEKLVRGMDVWMDGLIYCRLDE